MDFYRGEVELLRQRPAEALLHYERVIESETRNPWSWFRFFTFLRMAEAQGALQERSAAAESLDKALDAREQKDLLRHVARARKHYFENDDMAPADRVRADVRTPGSSSSSESHRE